MKIDVGTLAFGHKIKSGGGNPNWGTALGQGKKYKINSNSEIDEILKGMVYASVPLDKISTKIGKGGKLVMGNVQNSPIVLGAVFSKVFINDIRIKDVKFMLLITRDTSESHTGRLRLKYGPNFYENEGQTYSNELFWKQMKQQLKLAENACFFVSDINIINQDELVLKTIVVNPSGNVEYENNEDFHKAWKELVPNVFEDNIIFECEKERNRIIFGAPGTGKSFTLNRERKELLYGDSEIDENKLRNERQYGYYERVTFHPDYSYANFVGTYKPVPSENDVNKIAYKFIPGPFIRVYVEAIKNIREANEKKSAIRPSVLVIEEINRANVAAVFGDIFQLLDRKDGISEYPIQTSEDLKRYLASEDVLGGEIDDYSVLQLPSNMFIWATMNSADQGVFPMDTAFKRRWNFTYIGIDDNDDELNGKMVMLGTKSIQKLEWNKLRKAINNFLAKQKINEDKQIGPYFIEKNIVVPKNDFIDRNKFIEVFKNKVIMYLFEDAAKQKRASIFEGCFDKCNRYSEICKQFDENGIYIFHSDIQMETEWEEVKDKEFL